MNVAKWLRCVHFVLLNVRIFIFFVFFHCFWLCLYVMYRYVAVITWLYTPHRYHHSSAELCFFLSRISCFFKLRISFTRLMKNAGEHSALTVRLLKCADLWTTLHTSFLYAVPFNVHFYHFYVYKFLSMDFQTYLKRHRGLCECFVCFWSILYVICCFLRFLHRLPK